MLASRTYSITEMQAISGFDRRTIVYYLQQGLVPRAGRRGPHTRYPQEALLRLRFIRGFKDLQDQGRSGTVTLREIGLLLDGLTPERISVLVERGMPMDELGPLLEELAQPAVVSTPPAATPAPAPHPVSQPEASPETITAPVSGTMPGAAAAPSQPTPSLFGPTGPRRSYGLADAGIRQRFGTPSVTPLSTQAPTQPVAGSPVPSSTAAAPPLGTAATAGTTAEAAGDLGQLLRELEIRPAMSGRRQAPGASEQWTEIPITSRVYLSVRGLAQEDAPLADAVARELKKILRSR